MLKPERYEALDFAFELDALDDQGEKSEHDIVLAQGSRLWIGEVTKSDRFEQDGGKQHKRFERLAQVADLLDAYGIVLATSQPGFWDRVVGQANALLGKRTALRLITGTRVAGKQENAL
jgi:hypothetical protein